MGKRADELGHVGPGGGQLDVSLVGVEPAVGDVVADRPVEQQRLLGHVGDGGAQVGLGDPGDVLPVEQDPPAVEVGEPQQQPGEAGLARARVADQADPLAWLDAQVQPVEQSVGRTRMSERDVFEPDLAGPDP